MRDYKDDKGHDGVTATQSGIPLRRANFSTLTEALDYYAHPIDAYHVAFWCWAVVGVLAVLTIWPVRELKANNLTE